MGYHRPAQSPRRSVYSWRHRGGCDGGAGTPCSKHREHRRKQLQEWRAKKREKEERRASTEAAAQANEEEERRFSAPAYTIPVFGSSNRDSLGRVTRRTDSLEPAGAALVKSQACQVRPP